MSSISSSLGKYRLTLDRRTANALTYFAHRRRRLLLMRGAAAGLVFFILAMLVVAICDYLWLLADPLRWMLSLVAYVIAGAASWRFGFRDASVSDPRRVARQLESADPRLREDLLSAVELSDPEVANGSKAFRNRLQQRVAQRTSLLDVTRLLPIDLIGRWLMTGTVITLVCAVMLLIPRIQFGRRIARAMLPGMAIERASLTQIRVVKPSPPTGFVAEGDAVGIVVQVESGETDDIQLHWQTEDGLNGQTRMSPRISPDQNVSAGKNRKEKTFAANLSIGTTPVEYRVMAGDAVTLWNTLTPLPRPRVVSFRKRYVFPTYAKLPERVEETEHGDVKSLVGTLAKITVTFDEPVSDAVIRFGNRGVSSSLEPTSDSNREFLVSIPVRTPTTYQIDAKSLKSGLSNPFSPQYSITPVIDSPPVARWDDSLARTLIVSPLDVISLQATAIDDLPMERCFQVIQINGDPAIGRELDIDQPSRELRLRWDWDLMHRVKDSEESLKLSGGDIVRVRIVAVDRNNQRGESDVLELLVAEEGFDSQRHARLKQMGQLTEKLATWISSFKEFTEQVRTAAERAELAPLDEATDREAELSEQASALLDRVQSLLPGSQTRPESGALELIGRAVATLEASRTDWVSELRSVLTNDQPAWRKSRESKSKESASQLDKMAQDAIRLEQYARATFGEDLTTGIVADAMALRRSLQPMLDEQTLLPIQRFPRYLSVILGRLEAIDQLITTHENLLPESTRRHLQSWMRWSDGWSEKIEDAINNPPGEESFRSFVEKFDLELRNQIDHAMVDGRLASTVTSLLREIHLQVGDTSQFLEEADKHGQRAARARESVSSATESDQVAQLTSEAQFEETGFARTRDRLLERLKIEESLHRSRPNVDLRYAADMKLLSRAVTNVAGDGYLPFGEEPAKQVHEKLAKAFRILQSYHQAEQWLAELRALMLAERKLLDSAVVKIKHPSWIERFSAGLQWPVRTMREAGLDTNLTNPIDRVRYNDPYNEARNLIASRRWSGDEVLTAEFALDALQQELATALETLGPAVAEARATVQQYVPKLSEQAREAAEKAREAKQRIATREDSQRETAERLDQRQQEAERAARETLQSLVNLANTSDISDPNERELARDADAAAAQIQSAAQRAEQAMDRAAESKTEDLRKNAFEKAEEALDQLHESLQDTAEHFEKAENGEDLSDSRQQLRQSNSSRQQDLDDRYERAGAMAETAASTPEELMKRLEEELQQNPPMQEELSEIAQRAAESARRTLQQAAEDETNLNRSLERSDPTFQEKKRRMARLVEDLAVRSASIDAALLSATERAIGWANTPEVRPRLQNARRELQSAVRQANELGGDSALLSDIRETATQMSRSIGLAERSMQRINRNTRAAEDVNIHRDDASRARSTNQLERFARDARQQQIRSANSEVQQWASAERDAGRRVSQAQRRLRDAENQKQDIEQRIERDDNNNQSLRQRLTEVQRVADEADRAQRAAKETKDFAERKSKSAQARSQSFKQQVIESLEAPNPAAELATRMTSQAGEQLSEISAELDELMDDSQIAEHLRVSESQLKGLSDRQSQIARAVETARDQLRRAARHEERLGQQELAERLDSVASQVDENAVGAVSSANETLVEAQSDIEQSPEAGRQVAQAATQILASAAQLAELLGQTSPEDFAAAESNAEDPNQDAEKGEQLARTLDELDRALNPRDSEGDSNSQQQERQQEQAGEQSGESSEASSQTAGEASPTLEDALNQQAQQSARQRRQQMNPNQADGQQQQGPPSDQPASGAVPGSEPGGGTASDGGALDTRDIDRLGSDWGQLRERRAEDASEQRTATIAPQYRREIEAYFKALAERAAMQNGAKRDESP